MATVTIQTIKTASAEIRKTNPTTLFVTATGDAPTLGHTNPRLEARVYVNPPADGIQELDFQMDGPDNPAGDQLEEHTAELEWQGFPDWIKGVKVYGTLKAETVKL